jgi:cysteine desulfurase
LEAALPKVIINGDPEKVAPHVASISFPGASGELILLRLDMQGFAVSLGSACTSRDIVPSHVLQAMGLPSENIEGTLRISFGEQSTEEEVDQLLQVLPDIVLKATES